VRRPDIHPRITPMRALVLLERVTLCRGGRTDSNLLSDLADALASHIKAELTRRNKRTRTDARRAR
jgi:hypothetical protein